MWLYYQIRQKHKQKDQNTSNDETQTWANASEVGAKEGIELT
jgi:hypothetical protein